MCREVQLLQEISLEGECASDVGVVIFFLCQKIKNKNLIFLLLVFDEGLGYAFIFSFNAFPSTIFLVWVFNMLFLTKFALVYLFIF